ncbi:hypothetical protein BHE74_00008399 [Ensete ventricosum]|nr:hypothetical protein BHE74_00008399 [Ensete ventricosum]
MAGESARLGPAHVRKVVSIDRESDEGARGRSSASDATVLHTPQSSLSSDRGVTGCYLQHPRGVFPACSTARVASIQPGLAWVQRVGRRSRGRPALPSPPYYQGVSRVVEDFTESGGAQLVALLDCIPRGMPTGGHRPIPRLVYGMFSPLQEPGRLILNCPNWFQQEIEDLKSGASLEAIAVIERQATELLTMNEKLKADLDEAGLQLDASDKEINDNRNLLTDAQKQIKDMLARG